MDAAGMAMWMDVQLEEWAKKHSRKPFVVMDNFSGHTTAAVRALFIQKGFVLELLAANTTSHAQARESGGARGGARFH